MANASGGSPNGANDRTCAVVLEKKTMHRRPELAAAALVLSFAWMGPACSPSHPSASNEGAPPKDWRQALANLSTSGNAIYSFRFDGAPPAGAFYTVAVHQADTSTACGRYGADVVSKGQDFWFFDVSVNDASSGEHAIALPQRDGNPSPTANVTVLHRKDGAFVEAYDAVGGSVRLDSAPTPPEASGGVSLLGRIEADFPSHAVREVSCQGGVQVDGGGATSTCNCVDSDGVASTCVPDGEGHNCCPDVTSPPVHIGISLRAVPCANMCRWAAGLSVDYCSQYFGQ
jgi:hypothetical protein